MTAVSQSEQLPSGSPLKIAGTNGRSGVADLIKEWCGIPNASVRLIRDNESSDSPRYIVLGVPVALEMPSLETAGLGSSRAHGVYARGLAGDARPGESYLIVPQKAPELPVFAPLLQTEWSLPVTADFPQKLANAVVAKRGLAEHEAAVTRERLVADIRGDLGLPALVK